jgi:hypothetical protein
MNSKASARGAQGQLAHCKTEGIVVPKFIADAINEIGSRKYLKQAMVTAA